ncbi:DUF4153 domain-containing protein [Candidatus Nomurabacteria bacterium]|nr:DUF4153 domain-containing protein [Candidatus Nomurabacteria bacterium]
MKLIQRLQQFSVHQVLDSAWQSIKRFPAALLAALIATGLGLYLIQVNWASDIDLAVQEKTLMMAVLAVPLFVVATLLAERHQNQKYLWGGLHIVGLLALVMYYIVLPDRPADFSEIHVKRYVFFQIMLYVLLFSVSHWDSKQSNGLWYYGFHIFIRCLTTFLFSIVLFAGLSLAFWSIDYLFGMNFDGDVYARIMVLIAGIFVPLHLLGGVPKAIEPFVKQDDYPTLFRILTQFILVPLLSFFFVILYIYLGKIVFTWDWPLGGTAYWVITYCGFAVLTFVLAYPLRLQSSFHWLRKFLTGLFVLTIPLAIVLFMAIGIRIFYYGWTENRYMVVLLGVWLVFTSLYYLFSKEKALRVIPISFVLFLFFTMWGPWGMFSVGMRSQVHLLENILQENGVLVDGKIQRIEKEQANQIGVETMDEIRSKFQYIIYHDGADQVTMWFNENIQEDTQSAQGERYRNYRYTVYQNVQRQVGFEEYYPRPIDGKMENFVSYNSETFRIQTVPDFDYSLAINGEVGLGEVTRNLAEQYIEGEKITIKAEGDFWSIQYRDETPARVNIVGFVEQLQQHYGYNEQIRSEEFSVPFESESIHGELRFRSIYSSYRGTSQEEYEVSADVYFSIRSNE